MSLHPDSLNADCTCITLDRTALCRALDGEVGDAEFCRQLVVTHPTLISHLPVFLRGEHVARMAEIITAIEAIAKLEGYQNAALQTAPAIARFRPGPIGVLMGYDFHLGPDGPKLIEINTNAGGALINAFVARAQKACCSPVELMWSELSAGQHIDTTFVDSFRTDWRLQRGDQPLIRIAVVDANPAAQYLYPEFVLFQRLFRRHNIDASLRRRPFSIAMASSGSAPSRSTWSTIASRISTSRGLNKRRCVQPISPATSWPRGTHACTRCLRTSATWCG